MAWFQRFVSCIERNEGLDKLAKPATSTVAKVTSPAPVKNALSGTWLGHPVHPPLTDVPIGAWTSAMALDLLGGEGSEAASRRLIGLGIMAALPTAAAGLSDWSDTYGPEQRVGLAHGLGNSLGVLLFTGSWLARRQAGRRPIGTLLGLAGLGAIGASAYLGGHLAFVRGVQVNHTAFQEPSTDWTPVKQLDELEDGKPARADVGGVAVVLVRQGERVAALSATCVHAGGPLDEGSLVDSCIRCPWHGSTFRLSDGKVVRGPATTPEPAWETRVRDGKVEVRSPAA